MQISRHWRLNAQRYRLEGFRNENGELSLQSRRPINNNADQREENEAVVVQPNRVPSIAAD